MVLQAVGVFFLAQADWVYLFLKANFPVSKEKGSELRFFISRKRR